MTGRILVLLVALAGVSLQAQTPRSLTKANANVSETWTLTGYEVHIPDAAQPLSGSIGIRFQRSVTVDGVAVLTESRAATISGPPAMLAIMTAIDTEVRALIAAKDPNAYYSGTRKAFYDWLQANGHIDKAAR